VSPTGAAVLAHRAGRPV